MTTQNTKKTISTKILNGLFAFKTYLKPIARIFKNGKIRNIILEINGRFSAYAYKKSILQYYSQIPLSQIPKDKQIVIDFLKHNSLNLFPYYFIKKYKSSDIKVFTDTENGLKYTLLENKRLYFRRRCSENEIKKLFSELLLVQDENSPHRYLVEGFYVNEDDIVADFGAAEGDFALLIVEKAKKVYLFESDPELLEALEATFKPWKDKVIVVSKYISDTSDSKSTTLDEYFKDKEAPTYLKVDIEGAEQKFIDGGKSILSSMKNTRVIMASYHRHNDEESLSKELQKLGFKTSFSEGYMLSIWDDVMKEPYLRKALIRANK